MKGLTQSNADTKQQTSLKPEPFKSQTRDTPVRAEPPPPPPPKRPHPVPQSAPRPTHTTYHQENDIQEVKSEPVPHPPESQTHMSSVKPVYTAALDDQMTGVVADPNNIYISAPFV